MKHDKLTIGQIAKLLNISPDTLKHYEKKELIIPKYIDPNNSYRYYSPEQLYTLLLIQDLRRLDFSISEIRAYLEAHTIDKSITVLRAKIDLNKTRINQLLQETCDLSARLSMLESHQAYCDYKIEPFIKEFDDRQIITLHRRISVQKEEYLIATELERVIQHMGSGLRNSIIGQWFNAKMVSERAIGGIAFVLSPTNLELSGNMVGTIKGGSYLCAYQTGLMETAPWDLEIVHKMYDMINQMNAIPRGEFLQLSLIDEYFTDNQCELLYEIQIPFEAK